jgi:NitT/TauT family transport system substrate-binding protein
LGVAEIAFTAVPQRRGTAYEEVEVRKSRILFGVFVASAALILSGCAASGSTPAKSSAAKPKSGGPFTLQIVQTTPSFSYLPLDVIEHATGATNDLTISTTDANGGAAASQLFSAGTGQILVSGGDGPARLLQTGVADVTVIASLQQNNPFVIVSKKGSSIKNIKDLEGKTIGITGVGSETEVSIQSELVKAGVPLTSVHLIALGSIPALIAALDQGSVQAIPVESPYLETEQASGDVQIVDDLRSMNYPSSLVVARTKDVEANPGAYCAFNASLKAAMEKLYTDHPYALSEAAALLGPTGGTQSQLKEQLNEYLKDSWTRNIIFTQAQYNTLKRVLTTSGEFQTAGFPTFAGMTKSAPKCK